MKAKENAYFHDPLSNSSYYITSNLIHNSRNQGYEIYYNSKENPFIEKIRSPVESEDRPPALHSFLPMRFLSLSADQNKPLISHSGLTVTSTGSEEELCFGSVGFSQGIHYWEIICPLSCDNISVGVIKEGFSLKNSYNQNLALASLWQFRTSTPRVIGIRIDFNTLEVRCWLNGNYQPQRILKISEGKYHPCIKIREKGNQILINPFGKEPNKWDLLCDDPAGVFIRKVNVESLAASCQKDSLKDYLSKWALIEGTNGAVKNLEDLKKILPEIAALNPTILYSHEYLAISVPDTDPKKCFESIKEKYPEIKLLENVDEIATMIINILIDPKIVNAPKNTFLQFLSKAFLSQSLPINEINGKTLETSFLSATKKVFDDIQTNLLEKIEERKDLYPLNMQLVNNSESLLLVLGNKLKLIRRNENKSFEIPFTAFEKTPQTIENPVKLEISKVDCQFLLREFPWDEFLDENSCFKPLINDFFLSLTESYSQEKNLIITLTLHKMKIIIDSLLNFLQKSLKKLRNYFKENEGTSDTNKKENIDKQFKEENSALPFADEAYNVEEKEKKPELSEGSKAQIKDLIIGSAKQQPLSLETCHILFSIVSRIDSQLFLSLQDKDEKKLTNLLYPENASQSHLAITRLSSFINYNNSGNFGCVELAEAGLCNTSDHFQDLRHYLDSNKQIENLQNLRLSDEKDIWRLLQSFLPHNRMLQGLRTNNFSLEECIKALPYQIHNIDSRYVNEDSQENLLKIQVAANRPYLATFSKDGSMSFWNTELFLIKLCEINFRESFNEKELPSEQKPLLNKNTSEEEEEIFGGFSLFDESLVKPSKQKEPILKKSPSNPINPPPPPKEPDVIPDPGMVEALYNMGFPVELAKKALIKVKNADLSMALDTLLVIQEEESKNPNKGTVKTNTTLLKPQWQCHACTFVNMNSNNKICHVCGTQAPLDAYYTEEEMAREEEAQNKLKEEKEKMSEVIPYEPVAQEKPVEKKPEVSIEEKKHEELVNHRNELITNGVISGEFLLECQGSKAAGFLAGVAFSSSKKEKEGSSLIRIRRLGIKSSHFLSFFYHTKTDHGYVNNITREWVRDETIPALEESLFEEGCRFNVEVLDAFYNNRTVYETLSQLEIDVPLTWIEDITWFRTDGDRNKEGFVLCILGKNKEGQRKILFKELTVNHSQIYEKPISFFFNEGFCKELDLPTHNPLEDAFLYKYLNTLYIANEKTILTFNISTFQQESQEIQLNFSPKAVRVLQTPITKLVFLNKSDSYELVIPSLSQESNEKPISPSEKDEPKVPEISLDPQTLTLDELTSLRSLLSVQSLGFMNENSLKTHKDKLTGLFTKHFWLYNQGKKEIEINLQKPETLVNIVMELYIQKKIEKNLFLNEVLIKGRSVSKSIQGKIKDDPKNVKLSQENQEVKSLMPAFSMNPDLFLEDDKEGVVKVNAKVTANMPEGTYLPLRMKYFEGAAYNNNIHVSKMLIPNKEIFITNYYNAYFVLEHLHEGIMNIDSVVIQSDFTVINGGFPLGAGLIFLSNSLTNFFVDPSFQSMTPAQYKEYASNRTHEPYEWEPVASFLFDEKSETLAIDLDYKRPCKYVLIKPTNMRTSPKDFSSHFKSSPIEIRFMGIQGSIVDKAQTNEIMKKNYFDIPLNTLRKSAVNFGFGETFTQAVKKGLVSFEYKEENSDQWKKFESESLEINAREFCHVEDQLLYFEENPEKFKNIQDKLIPLSAKVSLELMERSIKSKRVKALKLVLHSHMEDLANDWETKGFSIELLIPKTSALRFQEHQSLRQWLIDLDLYDKFIKELVKNLTNEKLSGERKKTITSLLNELMELKGQNLVNLIYKDLNLLDYIKQNIIKERVSNNESCNFLRIFTQIEKFPHDLLTVLFKLLGTILTLEITPLGLKSFFGLLSWCHHLDYETSFFEILGTLQMVAKRIKLTRSPNYNLLRVQYNIGSLAFEKDLFSSDGLTFKKKSLEIGKKVKGSLGSDRDSSKKNPIKTRVLIRKTTFGRKLLIDLGHEHSIDDIGLMLEKSDQNNVKLLIKVWAVDSNSDQKKLIHNDFYRESTYIQLSSYAYLDDSNKNCFTKEDRLNTLGFSQIKQQARFLMIQITHAFNPAFKLATEQIANNIIIPEVYGTIMTNVKGTLSKKAAIYQDMLTFKSEDLKAIPTKAEGILYEIKDKKDLLLYEGNGPSSLFKKTNVEGQGQASEGNIEIELIKEYYSNEEKLFSEIANLQTELSAKLFQYRSCVVSFQEKKEIGELCEAIEETQLQLLNLRQNKPSFETQSNDQGIGSSNLNTSLDFLYTLILKLSSFLRKIDGTMFNNKAIKSWRQNDWIQQEKGKYISLDLFESLVIYEINSFVENPIPSQSSAISSEIIKLLTEVLIDNLNEREWQHFIIMILKKYLSQPISIANSPIDKIFSHQRIIQALDHISIPNGEILAFLAYKLGIKYDSHSGRVEIQRAPLLMNISPEERKTHETSLLCTIVSILILLHKGFSKIPFYHVDTKKVVHKGSYCFNCGQSKFISGTRLKCLNCPNLDSCSNGTCENKHLLSHPNHCFIFIEEPLPLAPSKRSQPEPIALSTPFIFSDPLTDVHGVQCENCHKDIQGIRMMCANCEEYSLCKTCYDLRPHIKYHVFIKIDNKIHSTITGTPKCLVQMLDPLLYPLKTAVAEGDLSPTKKRLSKGVSREVNLLNEGRDDGEMKIIGLKKSVSSPARDEEYLKFTKKEQMHRVSGETSSLIPVQEEEENLLAILQRFDYEDSLKITMQICIWVCENSSYNDSDKINVLSISFDLLQEILKVSTMAGIKDFLSNSSNFLKIFLNVLKLGSNPLLIKFNILLENLSSPKHAPKSDEAALTGLSSYERNKLLQERQALDESRLLLAYHLQTVLHWVLDYALNPTQGTMYSQIFRDSLTPSVWLDQIAFVLELFLNSSEKVSKISSKKIQNLPNKAPKRQSSVNPTDETNMINSLAKKASPAKEIESEKLLPPGLLKSMSLPHDENENDKKKNIKQGFEQKSILEIEPKASEKLASLSLATAINLIDLLFPTPQKNMGSRQGFNFSSSTKLWSLVFKSALKVRMSVLSENRVFDSLINAFMLATEEIQHTMFQEILNLTQNMINQGSYQKEFSNSILGIIFKFIRENMIVGTSFCSFSSISFNLLKGWLDILLTKVTPKPEDYYNKSFEKAFCKLNTQGALQLLINVSLFLINHVNYGGKEGIQLATESDIMKMNLADDMLKLLIFSESQNNVFAVSELFLQSKEEFLVDIRASMKRIIDWFLLNRSKETLISPATDLMLSISNSVMKLFTLASESENISKICIRELIASCHSFDELIIRKFRASQISNHMALVYNEMNSRILEDLLDLWVTNDSLASFVAFEVKGFEFLLDRMGMLDSGSQGGQNAEEVFSDTNKTSLLSGIDLLEYIQQDAQIIDKNIPIAPSLDKILNPALKKSSGKDEKPGQLIKSTELKEEEFANKVFIINQTGQHWSGIGPDWSVNKKGIRARILFFQMSNQFYSEYSLMLELDKVCEMKQIKIGFNTVWTDYNDKVLGIPSSILLEGGLNKNSLLPLGTLELLNDEGYSNYSVKVFKKNFYTLTMCSGKEKEGTLESCLKSLNNKQVKVIRLTFRRPTVTFIESMSMLSNKTYKNICVAISFLSITGYDVAKFPSSIGNSLNETQKNTALQVLGKLCNSNYNETLNTLANRSDVIQKIKNSFDFLSNLLVMHENWLAPVFLAIAHNQETGDFIINKFLDIEKASAHAKMILEIILSSPKHSFPRLLKLYSFIKERLLSQKKSPNMIQNLSAILHFIDTLTSAFRLLSNDLKEISSENDFIIPCVSEDIDLLILSYDINSNNPQISKAIIKLIISLLYIAQPFRLKEEELTIYALDQVYGLMKKTSKIAFYDLLAQLIAGFKDANKWFLTKNGEKLEELLNTLFQHLEEASTTTETQKLTKAILQILNGAVSYDNELKQYILKKETHLQIYHKMKQSQGVTILKINDLETLGLLVEFIKNVSLGYGQREEKLAEALKQDLSLLETRRDMQYVTQFLIPLLNAETNVPVCLHPYDSHAHKWIIEGRKLTKIVKQAPQIQAESFNPKSFSAIHREAFEQMLKKSTSTTGLYQKISKSSWELAVTQNSDSEVGLGDQVFSKVLKNAPFIIILEGTNSGRNCITGVFSSQTVTDNPVEDFSYEKIFNIAKGNDNFLFYYEEEFCMHFNIPEHVGQNYLGHYYIFEDGGQGISIHYNSQERIFISFQTGTQTYVDINLYDMKPIDENPKNFPTDIPADFQFKKCEFWTLKTLPTNILAQKAHAGGVDNPNISNVLYAPWFNNNNPLNLYRSSPVYNVPASIKIDKMSQCFFGNEIQVKSHLQKELLKPDTVVSDIWEFVSENPESNRILDLDFDIYELLEKKKEQKKAEDKKGGVAYMPNMSIFEAFERCGGVNRIIEVILKSLSLWKNKQRAKNWHAWVNELHSFSNLPHFFGLLMKNKECIELLFQLLKGTPDEESEKKGSPEQKKWEEEEQNAVRFSYKILSDVFKVDNDAKIRDFAIENHLIDRFLDRIALISKENGRKYVEKIEPEKEEPAQIEKKKEEDDGKKKIVKKKGVGYASDNTGQNQKWNISEYHESKKNQSEQLQSLLGILETFLDFNDWKPPKKFSDLVCTSALLPLIEAAFRSGSLLDMSKDAELFICFLRIAKLFSRHHSLIPLLLDLDPHYVPKQTESIYYLLGNLKDLANIFKSCMTSDTSVSGDTAVTNKLANEILSTYESISKAIEEYEENEEGESNEAQIQDVLNLPLAEAYRLLLKDLRFDYTNMKDASGNYKHHYASYIGKGAYTPPQTKIVRLAQELADLSTALPIEHTNSIFVRCDQSRVDVMKALIMGSAGTPYGHGAYEYDIFFDDNYPSGPPKCNLETTGAGRVRFNPNLYSCGKVCLSLLGTWRGNATENWDPKLSTLLQVLVSLQAIIMSEEVYFNEPGYEGEAGTEEGERKNEAYCNIVRYCNIKYAMIDQMKNPSKGFETVIKRHFYMKKQEIMEEVTKWVKYAQVREASYTGLINDHNSSWCTQFKKSKEAFYQMMKDAVKELEDELNKLPVPSIKDIKTKGISAKKIKPKKEKPLDTGAGIMNLEDIDVSYEKQVLQKVLDITDEKVKDRWSRYIGAMGIEAVAKQANASVFLTGMGPLGVEIAKNIVLSGVKRFTLHDDMDCNYIDLAGQFFLNETDIGKNRASACLDKIQQLNSYVKVDLATSLKALPLKEEDLLKMGLKDYTLIVAVNSDYALQKELDKFCRKNKIFFIGCDCTGPFSRVFLDLGEKFEVLDKNGEELQEMMIKSISNEVEGKVELLQGSKHNLEDGDLILITGVEGMELLPSLQHPEPNQTLIKQELLKTSINGSVHKVKVINKSTFLIGDTRNYDIYIRNGLAKQIKTPVVLEYKSLEAVLNENDCSSIDPILSQHDFMKLHHQQALNIAYLVLQDFKKETGLAYPEPWSTDSLELWMKISNKLIAKFFPVINAENESEVQKITVFLGKFALTCAGQFSPLAAFMGGFVSQEIVKAITQKYMPIKQLFYADCVEVIPDLPSELPSWKEHIKKQIESNEFKLEKNRLDGVKICLGNELLQKILNSKIFMVGAGAIGCELLKNYAMLSVGTGKNGLITLTDPDVIETSNLNRQFLFREKHLRKPKSSTAAASALQMNPLLKGHVNARLDKVHEGTAEIFTDKFFEDQTMVTNALDNVQARRYIDMRCVNSKIPLIESGTLGPKGHVQVVIPYKTESYGSQEDPQEENEIPHCTLKMFPEETLHCVEWARDKFGKLFFQRPKSLMKILEDVQNYVPTNSQELKNLREAVTFLKKRPMNFEDCLIYARKKFQKYFVNDIRQLLHTYPLDHKTKEGNPFWTLPKRPPVELAFDEKDALYASFVGAFACLRASVFKIPIPKDSRTEVVKKSFADKAGKVIVADFKPSEEKSKAILTQVEEKPKVPGQPEEGKEEPPAVLMDDYKQYVSEIVQILKDFDKNNLKAEEFEKDNDENYHIDFIYSLANCRARNYKLDPMDWVTVKIKAGRIIPALATTTASIAGLQTIELVKVIKACKLEDMKNAFLNLAVPSLQLSEPGPPPVIKLTEKLSVNLWDRWEVKGNKDTTLKGLFEELKTKYGLWPKDAMNGSQAVYFSAIYNIPGKEKEKEEILGKKLVDLLGIEDEKYVNLTVTFSKEEVGEILKGPPVVRVYFE